MKGNKILNMGFKIALTRHKTLGVKVVDEINNGGVLLMDHDCDIFDPLINKSRYEEVFKAGICHSDTFGKFIPYKDISLKEIELEIKRATDACLVTKKKKIYIAATFFIIESLIELYKDRTNE